MQCHCTTYGLVLVHRETTSIVINQNLYYCSYLPISALPTRLSCVCTVHYYVLYNKQLALYLILFTPTTYLKSLTLQTRAIE